MEKGNALNLSFGSGVEGVEPRVKWNVALTAWFKDSWEVNTKPLKQRQIEPRYYPGLKLVFVTGINPQFDKQKPSSSGNVTFLFYLL